VLVDTPAIVAEGLVKRFGPVRALDGVSFEVAEASVLGFLGPNGAGKTTCVRVLATVLAPDAGRGSVLGRDVVREAEAVRYVIGLAGQYAAVDPNLTGRENLRLVGRLARVPRRELPDRVDGLLARFGLAGAADRPARTYSGGMRRRLDLAAALVHRPPVLYLDEPTTGLDLQGRNELWTMIRELVADGTTVLLTTQYLEEADRLADRVVVVDGGRVIADDTPAALKARLGSTVVELAFVDDVTARAALEVVTAATADHAERDGAVVRVTGDGSPRRLIELLRGLDGKGLAPSGLTVREPSLDDVFLALTGRHVPEPTPGQPGAARRRGAA
jgi:ABC-2 type transport system ATP-binding protein